MKKTLVFHTVAVDSVIFSADSKILAGTEYKAFNWNDSSEDEETITKQSEQEIIIWLLQSPARQLLLKVLELPENTYIAHSVMKPVVENSQIKPGDIDILLCEPQHPEKAVGIQSKRVKVIALNQDQDEINKLDDIKSVVQQANNQRGKFGFHRNYVMVIIEADGRKRTGFNVLFRGGVEDTIKQIYEFPYRENLHEDIGVIFVKIVQPTGRNFNRKSVVGVCLDKEAIRLAQPVNLTNRIKELWRQSKLDF